MVKPKCIPGGAFTRKVEKIWLAFSQRVRNKMNVHFV